MTEARLLAVEAAREGGKPLIDSRVEVTRAIDSIRICIETMRTQGGREIPMHLNAASLAARRDAGRTDRRGGGRQRLQPSRSISSRTRSAPPLPQAARSSSSPPRPRRPPACASWRSATRGGTARRVVHPGVSESLDVVQQLVDDVRVDFLSFIGSARVGWMLRSLSPGTRCALEHGGVAPVIVAADADLDEALPLIAKGGYYHAGQVCVSVQRVYATIHRPRFCRAAGGAGGAVGVGDPTLPDTEVGPLIRRAEVSRLSLWIAEAVENGGKLIFGGEPLGETLL